MDDLKDVVAKVLEKQGVLGKLRAELRANVFKAIDAQDQRGSGAALSERSDCPKRKQLLSGKDGVLLASLVREYLEWCNMQFTIKVYDPELSCTECSSDRNNLIQKLNMDSVPDEPLLLSLLKAALATGFQRNAEAPNTIPSTTQLQPDATAAVSAGLRLGALRTGTDGNVITAPTAKPGKALDDADGNVKAKLKLQSPSVSGSLDNSSLSSPPASPNQLSPTAGKPSTRPFNDAGPGGFQTLAQSKPVALAPISTKPPAAIQNSLPSAEANHSFTESIEIESDEDLVDAEVEQDDDEFDYSQLMGQTAKKDETDKPSISKSTTALVPNLHQLHEDDNIDEHDSQASLSLSTSALSEPGRIRARKKSASAPVDGSAAGQEDEEEDSKPVPEPEPSQTSPDISQDLPTSPKPSKLNPLPLKLGPLPSLGPLAPLRGSGGLPPLKDGAMAISKSLSMDKPRPGSSEDLKEELRRAGLLSSTDTLGRSASQSQELPPTDPSTGGRPPHPRADESSLADSIFTPTPSQSLDLPADAFNAREGTINTAAAASTSFQPSSATKQRDDFSDSDDDSLDLPMGGGRGAAPAAAAYTKEPSLKASNPADDITDSDDDSLDLPMGGSGGAPRTVPGAVLPAADQTTQQMQPGGEKKGAGNGDGEDSDGESLASSASSVDVSMEPSGKAVLKSRAGVYDAEMTVTSSLDIADEVNLELEAPDASHLLPDEDSRQHSWLGRGVSLDFRETGLSASDRSGELDLLVSQGDYLEPAENDL